MRSGMGRGSHCDRCWLEHRCRLGTGEYPHAWPKAYLQHLAVGFVEVSLFVAHQKSLDVLEDPELLRVQAFGKCVQLALVARKDSSRPRRVGVDYLIILGHLAGSLLLLLLLLSLCTASLAVIRLCAVAGAEP